MLMIWFRQLFQLGFDQFETMGNLIAAVRPAFFPFVEQLFRMLLLNVVRY